MSSSIAKFARTLVLAFMYPRPFIGLLYLPRYLYHFFSYTRLKSGERIAFSDIQPCLGDWVDYNPFDAHYFYQGAWLARRLAKQSSTDEHVDIGSSVLMVSIISAFVDTTFVDYRPLKTTLSGLNCKEGDILNLPFPSNSVSSLSCLHVIEHIGLGRYGDPLDPLGSVKAALELERVLKVGSKLFLS